MAEPDKPGLLSLFGFNKKPDRNDGQAHHHHHSSDDHTASSELVDHARAFQTLSVADVMTPRVDVVAIEVSSTLAEVVQACVESEHSRLPIYRETLDDPIGVVHIKDVLKLLAPEAGRAGPNWAEPVLHRIRRDLIYVPLSMTTADLLLRMQAQRIHMALVIDEFGGTDGLVTLEDLLEMLVGDISDEHDEAEDEGGWIADGRAPLEELETAMGEGVDLAPPDLDEEIDTVAGLVNALAGRVPQRRERIEHPGGYVIEVISADPRRVKRVRVRRAAAHPSQA